MENTNKEKFGSLTSEKVGKVVPIKTVVLIAALELLAFVIDAIFKLNLIIYIAAVFGSLLVLVMVLKIDVFGETTAYHIAFSQNLIHLKYLKGTHEKQIDFSPTQATFKMDTISDKAGSHSVIVIKNEAGKFVLKPGPFTIFEIGEIHRKIKNLGLLSN